MSLGNILGAGAGFALGGPMGAMAGSKLGGRIGGLLGKVGSQTSAAERQYMSALQNKPQVYNGPRVADFNQAQQNYFNQATNYANGGVPSSITNIANGAQGADTSYLKEQYAAQPTEHIQTQVNDATGRALSGVMSKYAGAGRLGSAAFADAAARGTTNASAPILAQSAQQDASRRAGIAGQLANYSQAGLGMQLSAANQAHGMRMGQLGLLGGVGNQQQANQQQQYDANRQYVADQNWANQQHINNLGAAADIKRQRREDSRNRWMGLGQSALGAGMSFFGGQ